MVLEGKRLLNPVRDCRMDGTAGAEKSNDLTQRTQRGQRDRGDMADQIRERRRVILL